MHIMSWANVQHQLQVVPRNLQALDFCSVAVERSVRELTTKQNVLRPAQRTAIHRGTKYSVQRRKAQSTHSI